MGWESQNFLWEIFYGKVRTFWVKIYCQQVKGHIVL